MHAYQKAISSSSLYMAELVDGGHPRKWYVRIGQDNYPVTMVSRQVGNLVSGDIVACFFQSDKCIVLNVLLQCITKETSRGLTWNEGGRLSIEASTLDITVENTISIETRQGSILFKTP